jgi:hypothetical protein
MMQGWKGMALAATLATCVAASTVIAPQAAQAASAKSSASKSAKTRVTLRQFTGTVTAVDKQNLTVEKDGKNPATKVFERHADMRTTGDLAKDAHVTVYYRDEGGRSVAHRVVVKSEDDDDSNP